MDACYADYEPTKAVRAIQNFVTDDLSNWYVRLSRRIFWKGNYSSEKIAAYQTLFECLETICRIASPIAPFYMDQMYQDLTSMNSDKIDSVHLDFFPEVNKDVINKDLEQRIDLAQRITSLVLSLRQKEQIKVRQPLQKIMIPVLDPEFSRQLDEISSLVLSEVNVKEIEYLDPSNNVLVKKIKPNFRAIGPRYGNLMKKIGEAISTT